MNPEGYAAFEDPYCYPGTTVLRNLLDIRDEVELSAFEVEISTLRAEEPLPAGTFNASHYRAVHHHLFQDVYQWAGQYRKVRISKGQNSFCYPEHIQGQMEMLFERIHGGATFEVVEKEDFLNEITSFLSDLNAIHPFREGNGRTQLAFVSLVGSSFGHPFCLERLNRDTYLPAIIASFSGNLQPLREELKALLA